MQVPIAVLAISVAFGQQHQMPAGMSHDQHLKESGRAAMGFDQDATTHHFLISEDGGAVQVTVKNPSDVATRDAVRAHLKEIERSFAAGDLRKPLMTHGELPPGVPVMQAHKDAISYRYEELPDGGRVRISTANPDALAAIHQFLRYQITDHKTGDPLRK